MKFVLCVAWVAGCGAEPAAQIEDSGATIASHTPARAEEKPVAVEEKMPLALRCEGEFEGTTIKYEIRRLPLGSLVYATVGAVEASRVSQDSSLMAHRIGLLVESEPPTFLRPEVAEHGFRLRAARLASAGYLPCWMP